ncbi:Pescadillo homolog [Nesidiocoris tenuis]|uniref:Pescadillo homolog n=1 Tax=Nesidiocoris tenuis TaxID=355587 RepID=A0ABN7AWY2_9HEMI|nr:Pescadillo homolog [Nesidiocoris tenuis]
MAGHRRKKYQSGEGAQYVTRATAMRQLQLSLKDFRRLCILKGIYPREPRNRKKAQRGATGIKTLYNKKDIKFLLHEPIIWKFREQKALGRKIGRAKSLGEFTEAKHLINKPIQIKLDHIIKERYPTFIDALRDLDDCLTLCHLFSTFPSLKHVPRDQSSLCRRLMLEFMQYVIHTKALRKVFISIKGYYFQVEIKGQLITWIMPHQFSFEPQTKEDVDFRIMSTFTQFYIVLLGFVNYRLYHTVNLFYPPRVRIMQEYQGTELVDKMALQSERIAALNFPLWTGQSSTAEEEEAALDTFEVDADDVSKMEKAYIEAEKVRKLKTLFKGMKVFLNREVPREPLVFVLRCFGAEVSWDKTLFVGSTFDETDETITHQIIDRPAIEKQYISRYYVQPQWVMDSVNARELLPVEKYFIGASLPPHLSPFVDESTDGVYHPPEEKEIFGIGGTTVPDDEADDEEDTAAKDSESTSKDPSNEETAAPNSIKKKKGRKQKTAIVPEDENADEDTGEENPKKTPMKEENPVETLTKEERRELLKMKMKVKPGRVASDDPFKDKRAEREDFKLREKMVHKKHKALYKSMMRGRALRNKDVKILEKKRALIEEKRSAKTAG